MKHIIAQRIKAFDFGGLSIADFGPGQSASASVASISVPVGAKHPEARSKKSDKYYYGLEGVTAFVVNGAAVALAAGDLLLIQAGEWFSYANWGSVEAKLLLIHVPPFDMSAEEFRR